MPLAAFPKCFLNALVVEKTMTNEDWIDLAADQLDIDGLEFYWPTIPADTAGQEALRTRVAARGLSAPMMCYSPDFISTDPTRRQAEIGKQKEAIRGSARIGAGFCRVLSGQRNPEVSRSDGIRMVADCIGELLPFAEEQGVCLILENHYKDGYWQFPEFAQKMDVFLELLDAIPEHPFFGVNYDPSNALIAGDDPIAMLQAVKHRLKTMHASDRHLEGGTLEDLRKIDAASGLGYAAILKHGVIGRGAIDYDAVFGILREIDFHGWISIEDGDDPSVGMEHLAESAQFLRSKMKAFGVG
ncbi:MAG: sugar phosphate isomerase/epimerase family protein [Opitutaceae bacterium]